MVAGLADKTNHVQLSTLHAAMPQVKMAEKFR